MPQRFLDLHHVATVREPACSPEVTFGLSHSYGLLTALDAHEWFIEMMYEYEEFEVETDEPGEPPLSFWSETVRGVMVG